METVTIRHKGHNVRIRPPREGLEGKYRIGIGDLVTAFPTVKFIDRKIRVYWDQKYPKRFHTLLRGSLMQFFVEMGIARRGAA
jgi:hypothetical protein